MASQISKLFFWTEPIEKIVIESFWWILAMAIILILPFLRPWWWLFAPIFLSIELRVLYIWWINWDYNYAKKKWSVLEIVMPNVILTPLKAMEDVFSVMWGPLCSPNNWREIWCEGGLDDAPEWMSWEIASIEGKIHYYIRVSAAHRHTAETVLYSHYPELEIHEVPDYTKSVPQNIPNKDWDVYGEDFILGKDFAYPIKTYEKFFEPQGEKIAAEEKRIDSIASLLELMSKLGPGEQFWLQFVIAVSDLDAAELKSKGEKIVNKLIKRPEKKKSSFWGDTLELITRIIIGPVWDNEKQVPHFVSPPKTEKTQERSELLLTPGEKEIVTEVENKAKKPIFRTTIRGVYVARRESFKPSNKILTRSYFAHFQTQNLNFLRFSTVTRPKTHYVFRKQIPFVRSRRMFRNYILRFPPLFPEKRREVAILNAEELATIYHFPTRITGLSTSAMSQVESKKGAPPPNLPVE